MAAFGDVNVDVVVAVPALPDRGQEVFATEASVRVGGSAANTAAALAGLGIPSAVIARVGADALGRTAREELEAMGVSTKWVSVGQEGPTGTNLVVVTPDGERTMIGSRGVNAGYDRPAAEWSASIEWLHLSAYAFLADPQRSAAEAALDAAGREGISVSIDVPTGVAAELGDALGPWLARADLLALGRSTVARLGGTDHLLTDVDTVAVTGGGEPVTVTTGEGRLTLTPPRVAPIDTTGAGDAFVAGLVAGRLTGLSPASSAALAVACGTAATRAPGTGPLLTQEAVADVLALHDWPDLDEGDVTSARRLLARS